MDSLNVLILVSGVLAAAASGVIGSLLVLRKMTLLSDALSHIALPGIALGILLNIAPLLGGIVFLFVGVALIWYIETKTRLAIESITGVLFVTALATGALLIPQEDMLETFFGSVQSITPLEAGLQAAGALLILALTIAYLKPLTLSSIAPDLSAASRISRARMELLLLALIALTIAVGVSFVGVLLMSALLIVPAVTSKNIAGSFRWFIALAAALAVFSLVTGLFVGRIFEINPGLVTVLVSAACFFVSFLFRRQH